MSYQYPVSYGHGQNFRRGPGGRFDDSSPVNQDQNRKLFIGGLSYETDDQSLRNHFEKYGEIKDCVVIKDPTTKKSRGFGFITFKETKGLDEAQKERPHSLDGKEVETKRAMPRDDPQSHQTVTKMFVGGLKDTTTEEMIREAFSGNITKIELIKDKATGKLRGFGFVTFDDSDTVDKHVLTKNFTLNGRRVEVKKALDKNEMGYGPSGGYGYNQAWSYSSPFGIVSYVPTLLHPPSGLAPGYGAAPGEDKDTATALGEDKDTATASYEGYEEWCEMPYAYIPVLVDPYYGMPCYGMAPTAYIACSEDPSTALYEGVEDELTTAHEGRGGDYGYAPGYGYSPYGPAPSRGGYGGGNYGPHGGYGNQGWNQGGNYGDYGYGHQGAGYGSGGYGGNYNRR